MSYDEAVLYCTFCTHNGYTDWRMPTKAEWSDSRGMIGWWLDYGESSHYWSVTPVRTI